MNLLASLIFGRCQHTHYSRVWTDPATRQKYVVCEGCKQQLAYSWAEMRVTGPLETASIPNRWR